MNALLFVATVLIWGSTWIAIAMQVGNKILKDFANATIADILVKDGKVTQIEFRNGITHVFNY